MTLLEVNMRENLLIGLIVGILIVTGLVFILYKFFQFIIGTGKKGKRRKKQEQPKPPTIQDLYSEEELSHTFLLKMANGKVLTFPNPYRGFLVVGGTGSGKSASVARQQMYDIARLQFSGILYDFKYPALVSELAGYLAHHNSPVNLHILNCTLEGSGRTNPLKPEYIKNANYARMFAGAVMKNLIKESNDKQDFWSRSAEDLLAATIWYLREEAPEICTLPHAIAFLLSDENEFLGKLSENAYCSGIVRSIVTAHKNNAGEQLAGVLSTMQSSISRLYDPEIFYVLTGDDFSLNLNDPENPTLLCLGNDATLSEVYAPVISLIVTVALQQMNQPDKHPAFVLLDEAPTLYIPNLENTLATARSNQVAISYYCQDLSQITARYGDKKGNEIRSLFTNQLWGRTNDNTTAKAASEAFGKYDKTFIQHSTGNSAGGSSGGLFGSSNHSSTQGQSTSIQERDRIKPNEFRNFEVGMFAGFAAEAKRDHEFWEQLKMIDIAEGMGKAVIYNHPDGETPQGVFNQVNQDIKNLISGKPINSNASMKKTRSLKEEISDTLENDPPDDEKNSKGMDFA